MGLYWHLKSLVLKGSTFNQWTTKSVTLELVNEFYFKGSILEFTKVFFPDNLLGNLQRRFEPRKSTGTEVFSIVMCLTLPSRY